MSRSHALDRRSGRVRTESLFTRLHGRFSIEACGGWGYLESRFRRRPAPFLPNASLPLGDAGMPDLGRNPHSCGVRAVSRPVKWVVSRVVSYAALIVLGFVAGETAAAVTQETGESTDPRATARFESEIRPLLIEHCVACHSGPDADGGLDLTSRDGLMAGGESGPAAVAGNPDASRLIAAVEHRDLAMPPDERLSDRAISSLRDWIEQGLAWPDTARLERQRGDAAPTDEDRNHWAFRPIASPPLPMITDGDWARDDLDLFVRAAQERVGLTPAPVADRLTLLRRVTEDLIGLPPTIEQIDAFLSDESDQAYEHHVDRLLASRGFGERWADLWFDWVRFAESDGYKADSFRPTAWRYRDHVVDSLANDLPFDRFVLEQLAGDLLEPSAPERIAATGYLRLGIYEYNQRDARSQWTAMLEDITETTADALLGLGVGCARCHDHKYDPISQEDYYRLQACFAGIDPIDDASVATDVERAEYEAKLAEWNDRTRATRERLAELEREVRASALREAIEKFPPNVVACFDRPEAERSSLDRQLIALAMRQIDEELSKIDFGKRLTTELQESWKALKQELALAERDRPAPLPTTLAVREWDEVLERWPVADDPQRQVAPGIPRVLVATDRRYEFGSDEPRRVALARWIVSNENPLTARVIVNRVWLALMGRGLVDSPTDFGRMTRTPAMPELLDFLADRWRREGWSLKRLVRQIVTSATYRQASVRADEEACLSLDPDRNYVWRAERRRLDAGQIRDAMLAASGELTSRRGGPSSELDAPVRSVYLQVMRNRREPLLDAFDFPDRIRSCGSRNVTTSPLQALLLMNHPWTLARATTMSRQVRSAAGYREEAAVDLAFRSSFGRSPTADETEAGLAFLRQQSDAAVAAGRSIEAARDDAWIDLCHGLLNSNEFLFLD